jgi:hypothetical protein
LRVVDRRADLAAVADDARVGQEPVDVAVVEAGDHGEVEPGERGAERLALAQDRQPREAGLEPLQAHLLEQPMVVGEAEAPLGVVVGAVVSTRRPPTPHPPVLAERRIHAGRT